MYVEDVYGDDLELDRRHALRWRPWPLAALNGVENVRSLNIRAHLVKSELDRGVRHEGIPSQTAEDILHSNLEVVRRLAAALPDGDKSRTRRTCCVHFLDLARHHRHSLVAGAEEEDSVCHRLLRSGSIKPLHVSRVLPRRGLHLVELFHGFNVGPVKNKATLHK